jgi:hypothetical protein
VISVDWYVNDQLVAADYGGAFELTDFADAAGNYVVRAHAYDDVVRHAFDGSPLDLVRTGLEALQQDVAWTISFLPGDYNFDGQVDLDDYSVWKGEFGSGEDATADGNHDGIVDAADYAIWRDHLGTTAGAGPLHIPEPSAGVLSVTGAIALGFLARRRVPPRAPVSDGRDRI